MNKLNIANLSYEDEERILDDLYKYFQDWYDFEKFCRAFLRGKQFDEVEVTQKTRDDGIDLNAVRVGFDVNRSDTIKYKIQAKRLKPGTTVNKDDVKTLRGILNKNPQEIGIFITTGKYTKNTYKFVEECNPKDIILINGIELVQQCIEIGLGFIYKPIINIELLDKAIDKTKQSNIDEKYNNYIEKRISRNDIKTRILPIPNSIYEKIDENIEYYKVKFNDNEEKMLKINRNRKFFSGITSIYRKYGLILDNKTYNLKESYWNMNVEDKVINVYFDN